MRRSQHKRVVGWWLLGIGIVLVVHGIVLFEVLGDVIGPSESQAQAVGSVGGIGLLLVIAAVPHFVVAAKLARSERQADSSLTFGGTADRATTRSALSGDDR